MNSQETLIAFLNKKASEEWELRQQPYLLSLVPHEFNSDKSIYQEILAGERLKSFVKRTAHEAEYKLVEHPSQKAKVGIIPTATEFKWADSLSAHNESDIKITKKLKKIEAHPSKLILFLQSIADLKDEELDRMGVPLKVILRLAEMR
ncbi:hypothetical protein [Brucella thiophenivorans]|uniref:hypothetical protein n=1 Tax=Brucella thiophenivorans TaxID=571255 RepID=UPI00117DA0B2|nr:hypothetical protein [Brucella thiophenivorans]